MSRILRIVLALVLVLAPSGGGGYWFYRHRQDRLPDGITSGTGRLHADHVDIATKRSGRIASVPGRVGDPVKRGQILATMETAELKVMLAAARGTVARADQAVAKAQATRAEREHELEFAEQELQRATSLVRDGHIPEQVVDARRSERDRAAAAVESETMQLGILMQAVMVPLAEVRRLQTQIEESTLTSPVDGRILDRLAQPGESMPAGGRILTVLDLTQVHMELFVPAADAGDLRVGAQARIVLDAVRQVSIPATVTFVSPEAQFMPKRVETRNDRDKLMIRIKVTVPEELVRERIESVKTGLHGVAYVRMRDTIPWPERLDRPLPPTLPTR